MDIFIQNCPFFQTAWTPFIPLCSFLGKKRGKLHLFFSCSSWLATPASCRLLAMEELLRKISPWILLP